MTDPDDQQHEWATSEQPAWEPQPTLLRGDTLTLDRRLDRLVSFDPRSRRYPTRTLLAEQEGTERPPPRSLTWPMPWPALNQRRTGHCVGFGHGGRVKGRPVAVAEVDDDYCHRYYKRCQDLDEWAGSETEEPRYEGSSVLAGGKTGVEWGAYESYHWDFTIEDQILSTGYVGSGVVGTYWLESMFYPRRSGLVEVHGTVVGGHCYLRRGVRLKAVLPGEGPKPLEVFRYRNSWGPEFGIDGDFYMLIEAAERLHKLEGDSMVPVEPGQRRTEV